MGLEGDFGFEGKCCDTFREASSKNTMCDSLDLFQWLYHFAELWWHLPELRIFRVVI